MDEPFPAVKEPCRTTAEDSLTVSEEEVFLRAISLHGKDRDRWLEAACAGDPECRERVEALLAAHDETGFMMQMATDSVVQPAGSESREEEEREGARYGAYELVSLIGAGGFGTVWRAREMGSDGKMVALKILKLGMDTREVVSRFNREQQLLARMDHPNIARVYGGGATHGGRLFIAMELVDGVNLSAYCESHRLSLLRRLHLFLQLCEAIKHAHQKGIIHRDLKPSNLLVSFEDGRAVLKVIDFGVAKAVYADPEEHSLHTRMGQVMGTLVYMSPEQAGLVEADVDTRTDIYSMGIILYELLTSMTPMSTLNGSMTSHEEVRRRIRDVTPPLPSQMIRGLAVEKATLIALARMTDAHRLSSVLKGDLDWIVMRCIEKQPSARYESAGELGDDVLSYLCDKPVRARAPSRWLLLRKAVRRNPGVFAASAAAVVCLLAGTAVSLSWAYRSNIAEEEQRRLADEAERRRVEAMHLAYEADMSAASLLLAKGNTGQVRQFLERQVPRDGAPDFRGFEWRYLNQEVRDGHVALLRGHRMGVGAVAFSRDGNLFASGDMGGRVNVWELGKIQLLKTIDDATSRIIGVSFSHDGRYFAAGDETHLRIWTVPDFRLERKLALDKVRPVYSPTGPVLALGVGDARWNGNAGETRLWSWDRDLEGKEMRVLPNAGTRMAFTADGGLLATGAGLNQIYVWDVVSGERRARFNQPTAMDMAIAHDGAWLAATTRVRRNSPSIWSLPGAGPVGPLEGVVEGAYALAASPVANVLAAGSANHRVSLWDMNTFRELESFIGHRQEVQALAFSSDGKRLASGGGDRTARIWKIGARRMKDEVTSMHAALGMGGVRISPDGRLLAAQSADRVLKLFHGRDMSEAMVIGYQRSPLGFSSDGQRLATFNSKGLLEWWDTKDGECLGGRDLKHRPHLEGATALSPDGAILSMGVDGDVHFYDTQSGDCLLSAAKEHQQSIGAVAFSPDGKLHATVALDGTVVLRSVPDGIKRLDFRGHNIGARGLAFSPDSQWLATGGYDHLIKIWDVSSGDQVAELRGHSRPVLFLAFTSDGKTLLSSGDGDQLFLWRTGVWRFLGQHLIPAPVRSMALSNDSSLLGLIALPGVLKVMRAPASSPEQPLPASLLPEFDWDLRELPPVAWPVVEDLPPRGEGVPTACLDLSAHYNAPLDESWTTAAGATLGDLEPGVHRFNGVDWDVRGIMQVYPRKMGFQPPVPAFPDKVTGIKVHQKAASLNFLGAVTWGKDWKTGYEAGRLVIRYEDGVSVEHRLKMGRDVLGWLQNSPPLGEGNFSVRVAWSGPSQRGSSDAEGVRLFHFVWHNPRLNVAIREIDFVATEGCPFITAITAVP